MQEIKQRTVGMGKLFTVREAQMVVPLSRSMFYKSLNDGTIGCVRIGRRVFIPEAWLRKLVEAGE